MAMEDNESCNSRTIDSSPTNPRQQRQKLEVYNEVLRRLKQDSDIQEANLPGFDDELWAHFNRLPARYALDVNVERAQDVLTHKRLLQLAHDPANRPAFEVRLVQLSPVSDGHCNDSVHSNSPSKEDAQSSHIPIRQSIHSAPAPAFGSPRNLEVLALAADDSQDQDGESTVNAKPCFAGSRHEITISTDDKPKLLSQLTALLAEIGLDIEEAHAFSTVDGYSLDVFVVNGWPYEETEQLRHVLETEIWKIEIPDEVSPFICCCLLGIANNIGMLYMTIMKMLKAILHFPSMGNNFPIDDIIVTTELAQFGIFFASNKQSWLKPHPLSNDDNEQTGVEPILNHVKIPSDGIDVWEIDARLLKFETKVGSGSFGDLYKGTFHSQEVAIKVLKPERVNEAMQQEFAQEVYIMRKVRHRNVVQFIGACTRPPRLCIVTEFMSGGSVYDFLHKQKGIFKLPSLLRVAIDVSKGMNYLHQNNIVHRDLKAANLLMDENEVVKVADFGVARVQTQSGVMTAETGTYRWMAPEVIEHKPYDHKADIFSFGVVLWELLTAKVPYEYMTPLQAAVGVVQKGLRPTIPKNTHPKLVELLESCWQQDPALRPEFSEIIEILQQTAKEVRNQGEGGHREKSTSGFLSVLNRGHQ